MRHKQSSPKWTRARKLWAGAGIIVIIGVAFFLGLSIAGHQSATPESSTATSSKVKVQSSHKVASSRRPDSTGDVDVLSDLTEKAGENASTRTNDNEKTYSQFKQQNGTWYWWLTSSKRGTIEVGEVRSVAKDGQTAQLKMKSEYYDQGTNYTLAFHWLAGSNTQYNLNTDFKQINGDYTLGDTEDDVTPAKDVNLQDVIQSTVGRGMGYEDASTQTNGGDQTTSSFNGMNPSGNGRYAHWYWDFSSKKRGPIIHAMIGSVKVDYAGNPTSFEMSDMEKQKDFTVNVSYDWSSNTYHLWTSYQNIDGRYTNDEAH